MTGHAEHPLELTRYRATDEQKQAMTTYQREARTCSECGSVYRFPEFVRECAQHHGQPYCLGA